MVKTQTYPVEMTVDDLLALHGALNMIEALDDLVGESRDRTQVRLRLDSLRRRFAESREEVDGPPAVVVPAAPIIAAIPTADEPDAHSASRRV